MRREDATASTDVPIGVPVRRRPGGQPAGSGALDLGAGRRPRWDRSRRAVVTGPLAADVLAIVAVAAGGGAPWPYLAVVLPASLFMLGMAGLYRLRFTLSLIDDAGPIAGRVAIATALGIAGVELADPAGSGVEAPGLLAVATVAAVLIGRGAVYAGVRAARRNGAFCSPGLVLGGGVVAQEIEQVLQAHRELGVAEVLRVDIGEQHGLSAPEVLRSLVAANRVGVVIVAFSVVREHELVDVLRAFDRDRVEIYVVPRLFELANVDGRDLDRLWGIPVVRLRRSAHRSLAWRSKRLFDIVVSATLLTLVAPVLGICALAIAAESGRPVIFRQQRIGFDGRWFEILKLRSLRPVDDTEQQTTWNIDHDQRLTALGRFLRRSSLDELPQLWNVLRGDMSLVGPRPERPHFVETFSTEVPRYSARHRVPSGLTGWAQIHGLRGDTSIRDRARFDNEYIENWSLGLDIRILLRTAVAFVARNGPRDG